ncbi:MAG: hypothetical protein KBS41_05455, partial [Oscillospiraceae bacterium]|nr:hypothetical protein [Candidatus Equicaccousia limihippi]
ITVMFMKFKTRTVIFLCGVTAFLLFSGIIAAVYFADAPKKKTVDKVQSNISYDNNSKAINLGIICERYMFLMSFDTKNKCTKTVCRKTGTGINSSNAPKSENEMFEMAFKTVPQAIAMFESDRLIAEITKIGGFFVGEEYYTGVETVNLLNETARFKQDYDLLCAVITEFVKTEIKNQSGYIYECSNVGLPKFKDNREAILEAMQSTVFDYTAK